MQVHLGSSSRQEQRRWCRSSAEVLKSNKSNSAVDLERVELYTGNNFVIELK